MWRRWQEVSPAALPAFFDFLKPESYRFKRTDGIAAGWMEVLPHHRSSGPYFEVGCQGGQSRMLILVSC